MKKSELIKLLKDIQGDFEVTTSDKKGIFQDIKGVEFQEWERKASGEKPEKHASVTLILNGNDKNKTKIEDKSNTIFEVTLQDEEGNPNNDKQYAEDDEFLNKLNENLNKQDKIDKKDAFQARKTFKEDLQEIQNNCKTWFEKNYDKIARKAMIQLFEDEEPLDGKILPELKYYIYRNGWQNELPEDSFNNRFEILKLLYKKLEELIKEMMTQNAITSCQSDSKSFKDEECCKKEEQKSSRKNDEEEKAEKGFCSLFGIDETISKLNDILTKSTKFDGYFNMRPWIIW